MWETTIVQANLRAESRNNADARLISDSIQDSLRESRCLSVTSVVNSICLINHGGGPARRRAPELETEICTETGYRPTISSNSLSTNACSV